MLASIGTLLSPRLGTRELDAPGPMANAGLQSHSPRLSQGQGQSQGQSQVTLKNFGSFLPRPGAPGAANPRSPRLGARSPREVPRGVPSGASGGGGRIEGVSSAQAPVVRPLSDCDSARPGRKAATHRAARAKAPAAGGGSPGVGPDSRDGFEMFYGIGGSGGEAAGVAGGEAGPAEAKASVGQAPKVHANGVPPLCGLEARRAATPCAAQARTLAASTPANAPDAGETGEAGAEEWIRQVKELEAQLQAKLAAGPPAGAAKASVVGARPPRPGMVVAPPAPGRDAGAINGPAASIKPGVQIFSVATPAAPLATPQVAEPSP